MTRLNPILFEKKKSIGVLTINRPDALNALNTELFRELKTLLNSLSIDDDLRVIILTGAGDKAFVAGTDIFEMQKMSYMEARNFARLAGEAIDGFANLDHPTIAAVNGFALGGGCELAMACDLRVASDNARFGQPEINLGIIPGAGGTQRLGRLVGVAKAKEMLFTGKIIDAKEALHIGLVNQVVMHSELMEEATKLAEIISEKSGVILKRMKSVVNRGMNIDLPIALDYEKECFALCFSTEAMKEGMTAFVRKQKSKDKSNATRLRETGQARGV